MDMMMISRLRGSVVVALAAVTLLPCAARTQSKVATTAAQFLGIPVGPRAIAMGGAYVASGEDVSALYWNPGAVVQSSRTQFAFVNTDWLVGTKFRWVGLAVNLDGDNTIGASVTDMDYGDGDVTTVVSPEGTGEKWTAADIAIALTYSRRLTDRFSIGGSAKFINQRIYNESATTVAFDAGLLFNTDFHNLRIGMSMSNFGGDLTLTGRDLLVKVDIDPTNPGGNKTLVGGLKTDAWPLPLLFRVGVAIDVVSSDEVTATAAIDALRPNDNTESVNVGGEIGWRNRIFIRGGYNALFANEGPFAKNTQQEGLTLGAGLQYHVEGFASFAFDYAFQKFGLFGNLNTIGLVIGL
ncbi:MAG TPA: PorV/PorQ family protein [Bacteroidota bacterium]|nr:PorV/PorQ family protein [Bacteroidota bacterium]